MKEVTIYSSNWCPYCNKAKQLLAEKGVSFREINVDKTPGLREKISAQTGMKTIPQIFVGEKFVGGYSELAELNSLGKLDPLLK